MVYRLTKPLVSVLAFKNLSGRSPCIKTLPVKALNDDLLPKFDDRINETNN